MILAPIIIFAFNRLEPLKATIESLKTNKESTHSELFIFVDGYRQNKIGEKEKVKSVQDYVKGITGFKTVNYTFSENNQGLATSVINGVTRIINQYNSVIVLEDDLIVAPMFLKFMNEGLTKYRNEQKLFSICGYSNKVTPPKDYKYDTYFCVRSSSWGWATWKDRWDTVDWDLNNWEYCKSKQKEFNKWGGSDCWKMLSDWKEGKNKSWAIRFCFQQFLDSKLSLFPILSLVQNEGFDGEGTNCKKWNRFKYILNNLTEYNFTYPHEISINKKLYKEAMAYHTIVIRIWSRIMYLIK